jgi:hypothetical protein
MRFLSELPPPDQVRAFFGMLTVWVLVSCLGMDPRTHGQGES